MEIKPIPSSSEPASRIRPFALDLGINMATDTETAAVSPLAAGKTAEDRPSTHALKRYIEDELRR